MEGRPAKGAPPLASWVRGCNPRRPLGPVLGTRAQGLLWGQPSVFRAFILQHHDEVEISCTGPSNWPRRWCRRWCYRCWSRGRCCWCRFTCGVLIRAFSPRARRRFARGGVQPSREAEVSWCGAWPSSEAEVRPRGPRLAA
jgi:hypothetical protein